MSEMKKIALITARFINRKHCKVVFKSTKKPLTIRGRWRLWCIYCLLILCKFFVALNKKEVQRSKVQVKSFFLF